MTVVTEQNFDEVYPFPARDRFWAIVKRSLKDVFNHPAGAADELRRDFEANAPISEQLLVYHDEPLNIAADLAGVTHVNDAQQAAYQALVDSEEAARGLAPTAP